MVKQTHKPEPFIRPGRFWFLFICFGVLACRQSTEKVDHQFSCFRKMERVRPGHLVLTEAVDCSESMVRFKLAGAITRPQQIDHLDEDGDVLMSYRFVRRPDQSLLSEERVFRNESIQYNLYHSGEKMQFKGSARPGQDMIHLVTGFDRQGRVIKVEKLIDQKPSFLVTKKYGPLGIVEESHFDGQGKLKFTSSYLYAKGKTVEIMRDGRGKLLLKREIPR
jgi:hypothetical protein